MKPITYSILAAAALLGGLASAQTAYTTPVGYNTQSLSQGYNVVGLTLQAPTVAAGDFEGVSGTTLTDNELAFTPVSGRLYVLEITSGTSTVPGTSLIGTIQEVGAASIVGTTITTPQNLQSLGLQVGDTYKLRVAPTLEEIFTTTPLASGGVLAAALNIANSDIVWIPTGPGTFERYFLRSSGGFQRVTGTTTFVAAPNVPVVYADGLLVQKKTTAAASLTVSGEVKTVGTNSVIGQGYNLVAVVAPAGLTLRTAGFEDDLAKALNVANSDVVWIQKPDLSYDKYYFHSSQGWRDAVTNVNLPVSSDPVLGSAVYIQKRTTSVVTLDIAVPASYSSL